MNKNCIGNKEAENSAPLTCCHRYHWTLDYKYRSISVWPAPNIEQGIFSTQQPEQRKD